MKAKDFVGVVLLTRQGESDFTLFYNEGPAVARFKARLKFKKMKPDVDISSPSIPEADLNPLLECDLLSVHFSPSNDYTYFLELNKEN